MNNPEVKSLSREALEFAPGLLAIQEGPPEKLPRTILRLIAALFGILLLWAIFGKLDIVASAEGRLLPQTYVKIIQPAEAGIVHEILVKEGATVTAGEVLMRMDAKLNDADARTIRSEYELKRLQLRRIDAELTEMPMHKEPGDRPELYAQVVGQYASHRQAYLDAIAEERAVLNKTRHDLHASEEILRKLKETVPTYRKSAVAYEALGKEGFFSVLAVEEKQRERIEKEQDLRAQESAVSSIKSGLIASEKKLAQITSNYRSELQNERIETESQFSKLLGEKDKVEHKSALLELRAPQDGVIKELATHTIGSVVSPGTVLMSLVPLEEPLQAEVFVKNEDVGFVHVGQDVKVKLTAYPFQKYGMINGTVAYVGPDAADPNSSPAKSTGTDNTDPSAIFRYKALIKLSSQTLNTDGIPMRLSSGMQVVAEIQQGQRTIMEYLLSPVQKAWQEAGRER